MWTTPLTEFFKNTSKFILAVWEIVTLPVNDQYWLNAEGDYRYEHVRTDVRRLLWANHRWCIYSELFMEVK